MDLVFFDANCQMGRRPAGGCRLAATAADLIRIMDDYGLERALVWHDAQLEGAPDLGNRMIVEQIRSNGDGEFRTGRPRLLGSWTILPPQTREIPAPDAFFKQMKQYGIVALRAFPLKHRYLLNRVTFGSFLDEISDRRIPLFLSLTQGTGDWPVIYGLLQEYPDLTCIIADTGVWGTDRQFRPLLEAYPHVYLETSMLAMNDQVIEDLVETYGPDRLLFGSGFPVREPLSAMLQLRHAAVDEQDRQMIASGNLTRLIGEVVL